MQTPALFALKNAVVEGEAKVNMVASLRENFAQHGNCLQTGFLGTSILMQTLTDNGMVDIAYELLFQRRNPSWLYSVDNGATTFLTGQRQRNTGPETTGAAVLCSPAPHRRACTASAGHRWGSRAGDADYL